MDTSLGKWGECVGLRVEGNGKMQDLLYYTQQVDCMGKVAAQAIPFSDPHCMPPQVAVVHASKPDGGIELPICCYGLK
jgi:hypothetical protein